MSFELGGSKVSKENHYPRVGRKKKERKEGRKNSRVKAWKENDLQGSRFRYTELDPRQLFSPPVKLFVYFHNRFRVGVVVAHTKKERGAQGNDNHKVRRRCATRIDVSAFSHSAEVLSDVIVKGYEKFAWSRWSMDKLFALRRNK